MPLILATLLLALFSASLAQAQQPTPGFGRPSATPGFGNPAGPTPGFGNPGTPTPLPPSNPYGYGPQPPQPPQPFGGSRCRMELVQDANGILRHQQVCN